MSSRPGHGSLVGSDATWDARGTKIDPRNPHLYFHKRFSHENISTAYLPLPLIQDDLLSDNGETMFAKY